MNLNLVPRCVECSLLAQSVSMEFCIYFCEYCLEKYHSIQIVLQVQLIENLSIENEMDKLSYGGNKRFQEYLRCLTYLKGYHFDSTIETFLSPPVLYYREVLAAEYEHRPLLPYHEDFYLELSHQYSKIAFSSSPQQFSLHLTPKRPPSWVPDTTTEECMLCTVSFTFFNRRHHCRSCGLCVCRRCAPSPSLLHPHSFRQCYVCLKRDKFSSALEILLSPTISH